VINMFPWKMPSVEPGTCGVSTRKEKANKERAGVGKAEPREGKPEPKDAGQGRSQLGCEEDGDGNKRTVNE